MYVVEYKGPQAFVFQDLKGPSGKEKNIYNWFLTTDNILFQGFAAFS